MGKTRRILAAAGFGLLLAGCALPPRAVQKPETKPGVAAAKPATVTPSRPQPTPPPSAIPGWRELPPAAQGAAEEFLKRIAARDWDWVVARADPDFRVSYPDGDARDGAYLARLVRSGELAEGAPTEGRGFSTLDPRQILEARFLEARLQGPVAILYGSFILKRGEALPFALHILWRLDPPLFLGDRP